jgi:hypothetical protein
MTKLKQLKCHPWLTCAQYILIKVLISYLIPFHENFGFIAMKCADPFFLKQFVVTGRLEMFLLWFSVPC